MTVTETNQEWQVLQLRVHTFAACAVVSLQQLPEKLNPIIKPLMETIKKEENTLVQNYAAMNHSTPGLPVLHQLLEFTQTHVHRVGDAIQPSHLLPLEMNACLPGCVWNATPRSLSPLERNIGFWTQA